MCIRDSYQINREAILCECNHNGVVFTTITENCNGKILESPQSLEALERYGVITLEKQG